MIKLVFIRRPDTFDIFLKDVNRCERFMQPSIRIVWNSVYLPHSKFIRIFVRGKPFFLFFFIYLSFVRVSYFSLTSIESKNFFVISFERIEILFLSGKRIFAYISNKNFYFILFYFFFFGILKIRHVTVSWNIIAIVLSWEKYKRKDYNIQRVS